MNYHNLDQAFEMVAADSDSGSEPDYSEPDFSDSDDDMGQPPLQNVRSSRDIVDNFDRRGRGRERGRGTRARQRARGQRGHGRGRPRQTESGDADYWQRLDGEENYVPWIKGFTAVSGYTGPDGYENKPPADFISLFLTNDFWNLAVTETNRYAQQYLDAHGPNSANPLKPKSRFQNWKPVTIAEMKAFFSLTFSMGLCEKSEIEDYWAKWWITATPGYGKVMPRDRFEVIVFPSLGKQ